MTDTVPSKTRTDIVSETNKLISILNSCNHIKQKPMMDRYYTLWVAKWKPSTAFVAYYYQEVYIRQHLADKEWYLGSM